MRWTFFISLIPLLFSLSVGATFDKAAELERLKKERTQLQSQIDQSASNGATQTDLLIWKDDLSKVDFQIKDLEAQLGVGTPDGKPLPDGSLESYQSQLDQINLKISQGLQNGTLSSEDENLLVNQRNELLKTLTIQESVTGNEKQTETRSRILKNEEKRIQTLLSTPNLTSEQKQLFNKQMADIRLQKSILSQALSATDLEKNQAALDIKRNQFAQLKADLLSTPAGTLRHKELTAKIENLSNELKSLEAEASQGGLSAEQMVALEQGDLLKTPCHMEGRDGPQPSGAAACGIGKRSCEEVHPELEQYVDNLVELKMEYYYKKIRDISSINPNAATAPETSQYNPEYGWDLDLAGSFDPSKGEAPPGKPFPHPVCNLVEGEVDKDANGQSCGNFVDITVGGHNVNVDYTHSNGSRETSYARGTWLAALNCYKEQVKAEIQTGLLKVSPYCSALARDITQVTAQNDRIMADAILTQCSILGADQLKQQNCSVAETMKTFDPENAESRQSACYLQAARALTDQGTFGSLLTCEVFARADDGFGRAFLTRYGLESIENTIRQQVVSGCGSTIRRCKSKGCAVSRFKACYSSSYPSVYKETLMGLFPKNGACNPPPIPKDWSDENESQSESPQTSGKPSSTQKNGQTSQRENTSLFAVFASLQLFLRRKVRRKKLLKASFSQKNSALLIAFGLLMGLGLGSGCSSDRKFTVTYSYNCRGMDGFLITDQELAQKCCQSNNPHQTLTEDIPEECPQHQAMQIPNALTLGASQIRSANDMIRAAGGLSSTAIAAQAGQSSDPTGSTAQSSAAVAGNGRGDSTLNRFSPTSDDTELGKVAYAPPPLSTSGGGGIAGGNKAGDPLLSTTQPDSARGSAPYLPQQSAATDVEGTTYSEGAGGAGASKTKKSSASSLLGALAANRKTSSASSSSQNKEVGFGEQSDVPGRHGEDPTDYFARLSVGANIFKVIERRYRRKSMDWVLASSYELLKQGSSKSSKRKPASQSKKSR